MQTLVSYGSKRTDWLVTDTEGKIGWLQIQVEGLDSEYQVYLKLSPRLISVLGDEDGDGSSSGNRPANLYTKLSREGSEHE